MKVLIIDDWDTRHQRIRGVFQAAGRPAVFTSRKSPDAVQDGDVHQATVVFLDHDMCQAEEGQPCPKPSQAPSHNLLDAGCGCPTGRDLVTRMIALEARPLCVVHSQNPVGGRTMVERLREAGFQVAWSPVSTWTAMVPTNLLHLWGLS